jgi:hypothetical protein
MTDGPEQIEATPTALQAQRGMLDDAVVERP